MDVIILFLWSITKWKFYRICPEKLNIHETPYKLHANELEEEINREGKFPKTTIAMISTKQKWNQLSKFKTWKKKQNPNCKKAPMNSPQKAMDETLPQGQWYLGFCKTHKSSKKLSFSPHYLWAPHHAGQQKGSTFTRIVLWTAKHVEGSVTRKIKFTS